VEEEEDPESELYEEIVQEFLSFDFRNMARAMQEANYPLRIGNYEELNEKGLKLYEYGQRSVAHRTNVTATSTFRDTEDSHKFTSIFTGTEAVPLKKPWMEINENKDATVV
jgi:hypothetical protein